MIKSLLQAINSQISPCFLKKLKNLTFHSQCKKFQMGMPLFTTAYAVQFVRQQPK